MNYCRQIATGVVGDYKAGKSGYYQALVLLVAYGYSVKESTRMLITV